MVYPDPKFNLNKISKNHFILTKLTTYGSKTVTVNGDKIFVFVSPIQLLKIIFSAACRLSSQELRLGQALRRGVHVYKLILFVTDAPAKETPVFDTAKFKPVSSNT